MTHHATGPLPLLTILRYPDERLREVSLPISAEDIHQPQTQQLIENMLSTMYWARGIGLAAPQVAVHKRIVVMDLSAKRNCPQVFINPTIVESSGESSYEEGCLSVPGVSEFVFRPAQVEFYYWDRQGRHCQELATGLFATCIQHEIDHLNGKLYIDRVSTLNRSKLMKRIREIEAG